MNPRSLLPVGAAFYVASQIATPALEAPPQIDQVEILGESGEEDTFSVPTYSQLRTARTAIRAAFDQFDDEYGCESEEAEGIAPSVHHPMVRQLGLATRQLEAVTLPDGHTFIVNPYLVAKQIEEDDLQTNALHEYTHTCSEFRETIRPIRLNGLSIIGFKGFAGVVDYEVDSEGDETFGYHDRTTIIEESVAELVEMQDAGIDLSSDNEDLLDEFIGFIRADGMSSDRAYAAGVMIGILHEMDLSVEELIQEYQSQGKLVQFVADRYGIDDERRAERSVSRLVRELTRPEADN